MSDHSLHGRRLGGVDLEQAVVRYNAFFTALEKCFIGKEELIQLLKYALIQHEHVLVFGQPGTAKTAIYNTMLAGIEGANQFAIELSLFMDETALYGPYNPKKMREEGRWEHNTEGMLPEANLARLGEFLDANMGLLRSTLSTLNERALVRGRQQEDIPLVTAYCDTNTDPGEFLRQHPQAFAVLDRFLYIVEVDYLSDPVSIERMLESYQSGVYEALAEKLDLKDIRALSELTKSPPSIITDPLLFRAMALGFQEYRKERKTLVDNKDVETVLPEISDRRICWVTNTIETTAILSSRDIVEPQDLYSAHLALCTTEEERSLLKSILDAQIEEVKQLRESQQNDMKYTALRTHESELQDLSQRVSGINNGNYQKEVEQLKGLEQNVRGIHSDAEAVQGKKNELLQIITRQREIIKENYGAYVAGN